jgi:hypothetical protein
MRASSVIDLRDSLPKAACSFGIQHFPEIRTNRALELESFTPPIHCVMRFAPSVSNFSLTLPCLRLLVRHILRIAYYVVKRIESRY